MDLNQSIFKAYDIRGIYPSDLDEQTAYALGRAVATLFIEEIGRSDFDLVVGGDMRLSTPSLKEQLIAGIIDSGIGVSDIGTVSTPTYYFAVAHLGAVGGVQVSASHNPKEYNGFKIVREGGVAMSGETGILKLYQIMAEETFVPKAHVKGSRHTHLNVAEEAVEAYLQQAGSTKLNKYKIVADTANAMGAPDLLALFNKVPAQLIQMNFTLDGTFPSHEADPLKPENTQELRQRVLQEKADLGIATDGDSDRLFIVDNTGEVIPSAVLYTLIAKSILADSPNARLAYELRLGMLIRDEFESAGVNLVPTPVGHSLIKNIMLDQDCDFGGEISGHYFFRFPFGTFEAPGYLILKLLELLTHEHKPLSEIVAPYKRYFSSGEINTPVASRTVVSAKIEKLKQQYQDGKLTTIDGLKVEFAHWWFSLRASNTEPVLRLIVEADSSELLADKKKELLALLG